MLHFKFTGLLVVNSCKLREKGVGGYVECLNLKDHSKSIFLNYLFLGNNRKNFVESE